MCEGWLVYRREDWEKNRAYAGRLVERAGHYGLSLRLQLREELDQIVLSGGRGLPLFAVNRSRDWRLAGEFERAGCCVSNSTEVCRVGNDKIESHRLAASLGIPQVEMAFCANSPDKLVRHGLGYPVVLKDPHGHGGGGVFMAGGEGELLALAAGLPCRTVLLQRPCGLPGVDLRVYVLGGRVLSAVRRWSATDFRANLSLGGSAELCEPGGEELDMVRTMIAALPMDYGAVDFIYDGPGRPLFNEIEDAAGSRALYQLGGPDTADVYMAWLAERVNDRA